MRNEAEKTRSLKVAFVANAALLRRLATILGETSDKPEYTAFALSVVAILLLSLLNACQAPHQSTERTQTTAVSEPSEKEKPAAPWDYTKSEDALHGKSEDIFVLDGKYLSAPSISGRPKLVAICSKGKPEQLRLDTGVGLSVDSFLGFPVEKRLDGKFSRTSWSVYDNREDLSIPSRDFAQILAAHQLIVGINTIWATQAVIQFDMPNPEHLATACGLKLAIPKTARLSEESRANAH